MFGVKTFTYGFFPPWRAGGEGRRGKESREGGREGKKDEKIHLPLVIFPKL